MKRILIIIALLLAAAIGGGNRVANKSSGGGGGPFDPANYGTVRVWYKADAITGLTDGAAVTSWVDSGPNGVNAVSTGTPPIYKVSIQNGLPAVQFNGTSQFLVATTSTGTQPRTVFAVYSTASTANQNVVSGRSGSVSTLGDYSHKATLYGGSSLDDTNVITGVKVVCGYFNGGSSTIQSNGNSSVGGAVGSSDYNGGYVLGAYTESPSGDFFNGYLLEIIVYDGTCSNSSAVITALRTKWGF